MIAPQVSETPLLTVSPEARAFAEQQRVGGYLPAILSMTRRLFNDDLVRVLLEEDAEIEGYRHLVFEASTAALTPEQVTAAHQSWSAELLELCPARDAVHFVLGWR